MKKLISIWILTLSIIVVMAASAGAQDWAIKGNYTESCSCNPACPCLFGSPPTLGYCESNALLEIKEGHFGDVHLDSISVVMALRIGEWMKIYVSYNASDEQARAAEKLMKLEPIFGGLFSGNMKIISREKVPVKIERTSTYIKFSVPTSKVEIEMMRGKDGKPIKIQNLPAPSLSGHTQYKSIILSHQSDDKKFSYSGTNGFTSKIEAKSN